MANNIKEKIRKLELIRDNLKGETTKILQRHERDIVRLNINQMIDGYGSDDKDLFNTQRQFTGTYRAGYKKSGLYNFFETGVFLRGMFAKVTKDNIIIDSTGKGSGEKSLFITGYTNLFGLNTDSKEKLRLIILEEIRAYIKSKL